MYTSTRLSDALPAPGCPLAAHGFERAHLTGRPRLTFGPARNGENDGIRSSHPAWHLTLDLPLRYPPSVTAARPSRTQIRPAVERPLPHASPFA